MDCCGLQCWQLRAGTGCWGQMLTNDLVFTRNHHKINWIKPSVVLPGKIWTQQDTNWVLISATWWWLARWKLFSQIKRHHQTNPGQCRQTPPVDPRVAGPVVTSWTVSSVRESWSKSDCCLLTAPRQRRPATRQKHRFRNKSLQYIYKYRE